MLIAPGIGERLREERDRLGMNQTDFGAIAGVSRGTQKAYELGSSSPDVKYLAALQSAGVDVLYVVAGTRPEVAAGELSPLEAEIIRSLRTLALSDREHLARMAAALAAMPPPPEG
nr:helix-turn-helix transcriptional regulator [Pseudomonas sp. Pc102]